MERIAINVADYYGNPSYYSVMPQTVFDALERAFLDGEQSALVLKSDFEGMLSDYKVKMGLQ